MNAISVHSLQRTASPPFCLWLSLSTCHPGAVGMLKLHHSGRFSNSLFFEVAYHL